MPDFPIIDTHVHLWDPSSLAIPWLDGVPLLNKLYGITEFQAQTRTIAIEAMVYVEVAVAAPYALLEPKWVIEQVRVDPRFQAIVTSAPVEYGERARSYLTELVSFDPRIRGVRRLIQSEDDATFCLRPDFVRGVQLLSDYALSFELGINYHQMASAIALVQHCPHTAFILDHIGKPNIKDQVLDPWREQLSTLASYPNVVCKLSGMVTEIGHQDWSPQELAPYVNHVLTSFGEDRVLFGGDWPVVLLASSYERWVETLDTLTAHLTPTAKRKLWAENARRFYRLAPAE